MIHQITHLQTVFIRATSAGHDAIENLELKGIYCPICSHFIAKNARSRLGLRKHLHSIKPTGVILSSVTIVIMKHRARKKWRNTCREPMRAKVTANLAKPSLDNNFINAQFQLSFITEDKKKRLTCEHCGKHFHHQTMLKSHVERMHLHVFNYFCDQCDYKSYLEKELKMHMEMHTGQTTWKCEVISYKVEIDHSRC